LATDHDLDGVGRLGLGSFGRGTNVEDRTAERVFTAHDGVDNLAGEGRGSERYVASRGKMLDRELGRLRLGCRNEGSDVRQVDTFFFRVAKDGVTHENGDDLVDFLEAFFHVVNGEGRIDFPFEAGEIDLIGTEEKCEEWGRGHGKFPLVWGGGLRTSAFGLVLRRIP
jgi:hypothetical protein